MRVGAGRRHFGSGVDKGGKGIIQASLDAGAFDKFVLADGMVGESLPVECRTAVVASSRFAAPSLRYGPSGDPPPSVRRSASMAVSKLPATGRELDAGVLPVTATLPP